MTHDRDAKVLGDGGVDQDGLRKLSAQTNLGIAHLAEHGATFIENLDLSGLTKTHFTKPMTESWLPRKPLNAHPLTGFYVLEGDPTFSFCILHLCDTASLVTNDDRNLLRLGLKSNRFFVAQPILCLAASNF